MTIFQKTPGTFSHRRARRIATIALFSVALCSLALADGRIFRVARISLIEGEVSYQRANDSRKDWFDATLNLPLDESDQLYSGSNGRAEIQLSGRNIVRIDRDTNLRFTQFNTGTVQMALPIGSAYFRIDSLDKRQFQVVDANDPGSNDPVYFEVDTPTVAVTFIQEGNYRINVRDDGSTEVIVRRGQAEVYNQEIGTVIVKKGRRIIVEGRDDFYRITNLEDKDNWDRWNDRRDDDLFSRADQYRSTRYVPVAIPGVYDLDNYGEWIETPDYGWVWSPRGVAPSWAPYRDGYWRWYSSYGWTWVSYEPWGWAPYHYGRWTYYRSRWCWTPFGLGFDWGWRPHLVAFFGWGGRYNRGYRDGYYDGYWNGFSDGRYGWLGWCPLSPRDRYYGSRTVADNAPRTIEMLGNYNAPGGVRGMDARRFTEGRVVVSQDVLNAPAPPRGSLTAPPRGERGDAAPAFVRNDDLKPLQAIAPTRTAAVARGNVARRIEAPVVMRRTPVDAGGVVRSPAGSLDGAATPGSRPSQPARDGQPMPGRSGDQNATAPTRISNGQIERPSRTPDYRPAERVAAPERRSADVDRNSSERRIERSSENSNPSHAESPSRSERRTDEAPRRYDPPARPQIERRESAAPREIRRADPPPMRDSSPPRNVERPSSPPRESAPERPSSPPPARESAPARAPERPSSPPPARESAPPRQPERSPERPAPSRRPDSQ